MTDGAYTRLRVGVEASEFGPVADDVAALLDAYQRAVEALVQAGFRHSYNCNVYLDDESDAVLDDYRLCSCSANAVLAEARKMGVLE